MFNRHFIVSNILEDNDFKLIETVVTAICSQFFKLKR